MISGGTLTLQFRFYRMQVLWPILCDQTLTSRLELGNSFPFYCCIQNSFFIYMIESFYLPFLIFLDRWTTSTQASFFIFLGFRLGQRSYLKSYFCHKKKSYLLWFYHWCIYRSWNIWMGYRCGPIINVKIQQRYCFIFLGCNFWRSVLVSYSFHYKISNCW